MKQRKVNKESKAKEPKRFDLQKLGENSLELFGVSRFTFAGATYGLKGKYSIDEIKNVIEEWLRKEV